MLAKTFIVFRGGTGMGKSTIASSICNEFGGLHCNNDLWYEPGYPGQYKSFSWDNHLHRAIPWSNNRCESALCNGKKLVVLDNWHLEFYQCEEQIQCALENGYKVFVFSFRARNYNDALQAVYRNSRDWSASYCQTQAGKALHKFEDVDEDDFSDDDDITFETFYGLNVGNSRKNSIVKTVGLGDDSDADESDDDEDDSEEEEEELDDDSESEVEDFAELSGSSDSGESDAESIVSPKKSLASSRRSSSAASVAMKKAAPKPKSVMKKLAPKPKSVMKKLAPKPKAVMKKAAPKPKAAMKKAAPKPKAAMKKKTPPMKTAAKAKAKVMKAAAKAKVMKSAAKGKSKAMKSAAKAKAKGKARK